MHRVSRIDYASAGTPELYGGNSSGFTRAGYADGVMGSVHMGAGVCSLAAGGSIATHLHSFEESFYVLEGKPSVEIAGAKHELEPGSFGLIPTGVAHAWKNSSGAIVRWLEMQAPQPRE